MRARELGVTKGLRCCSDTYAAVPSPPPITGRENLAFAAHLKLPRDLADSHRRQAVLDDALEMLQLKHIQHYRVGSVEKRGISGGQRKRVNIGTELVSSRGGALP